MTARPLAVAIAIAIAGAAVAPPGALAQPAAEARNMEQVAQLDLAGNGDGDEGLALRQAAARLSTGRGPDRSALRRANRRRDRLVGKDRTGSAQGGRLEG